MSRVTGRKQVASIAAALLGCLAIVRGAAADPPDRVGRVSQVIGPVSFRPATLDEWGDAVANYPLTSGDNLWTDRAARAEVQLGQATARLGADTSFGVLNLDDHFGQFRVTQGSVALTVDDLSGDESFEVDTPNGAVSLLRPGFYRIDVSEAGDVSTVTVRRGEAEIAAGDGRPIVLRDNESARLVGVDDPRVDLAGVRGSDEWEDWCRWRDRTERQGASARYVSPGTIGYSDLDDFGTWRNVDQYGPVWVPRVRTSWAPYREGRWVWTEPWGWTWVDDQPWGFAPSHYGRWVNMAGTWGWSPGTRVDRAIYAPALVAFIGGPGGTTLVPRFGRVVPAWSGRCLRAVLPGQPELRAGYQRHQRPRHECGRASPLCEPGRARCGDRGGTRDIRERTTGDRGGSRVAGRRYPTGPGCRHGATGHSNGDEPRRSVAWTSGRASSGSRATAGRGEDCAAAAPRAVCRTRVGNEGTPWTAR